MKGLNSLMEETVIPLEDVCLTRFIYKREIGILIWGIVFWGITLRFVPWVERSLILAGVCLAGFAAGVFSLVKYFVSRKTYFQIGFPGGRFVFDLAYYPIGDVKEFQRQIYLAKEQINRK